MSESTIDQQSLLPDAASLQRLAVSESGFVFDPVSGHSFTVNETGLMILRALQQDRRVDALRERLVSTYEVDAPTLDRDLLEFLGSLRDQLLRS
ncbi:MAG: PqqD family protein [Gammaproteobacteria bacterium]